MILHSSLIKNLKLENDYLTILLNVDRKLIRKIKIFDVFQGGNIEKNKRSIALNLLIKSKRNI